MSKRCCPCPTSREPRCEGTEDGLAASRAHGNRPTVAKLCDAYQGLPSTSIRLSEELEVPLQVFPLPLFKDAAYEGTLFCQLLVIDERSGERIAREPIPPQNRIMAFRNAAKYADWPAYKSDGTPDFRFNPTFTGGGHQFTVFGELLRYLEQVRMLGDIFDREDGPAIPVTRTRWPRRDGQADAALFTALEGWTLPAYFAGDFPKFDAAVSYLCDFDSRVKAGLARSVEAPS